MGHRKCAIVVTTNICVIYVNLLVAAECRAMLRFRNLLGLVCQDQATSGVLQLDLEPEDDHQDINHKLPVLKT